MSFTCAYLRAGRDLDACDECEYGDCYLPSTLGDFKKPKRDAMDDEITRERKLAEVAGVPGTKAYQKKYYAECISKRREYFRQYRQTEKYKKAQKKYRQSEKGERKIRELSRKYYRTHPEENRNRWKRYYEAHKEEILEKQRERRRLAKCRAEGASTADTTTGCKGGESTRGGADASRVTEPGNSSAARSAGAPDGR